jgi:voltage-gated potassium channel
MSFVFNISLSILIFLNTIAIILNTIPDLSQNYHTIFRDFEYFSVAVFLIEYLLRLWSCVESRGFNHPLYGRIRFMFSFWGLVDLLAIAPFFLSAFATDFAFIRMLRLLRILRLFRMSRYFHAFRIIKNVLSSKREELILAFSFIFFLIIFYHHYLELQFLYIQVLVDPFQLQHKLQLHFHYPFFFNFLFIRLITFPLM